MKKRSFLSFWLLLTVGMVTVAFNSCGLSKVIEMADQYSQSIIRHTQDEGVIINGVKWATRNIDAPGTFAAKPEDFGMLYQWNRIAAWPATGANVSGWNSSMQSGTTWEKTNDPSPAGWRVPTFDEVIKLLDASKVSSEWTMVNGVAGRKFIDKTTGNSIFLPAVGTRNYIDGMLQGAGKESGYWSSSPFGNGGDTYTSSFYFRSNIVDYNSYARSFGISVRCVVE